MKNFIFAFIGIVAILSAHAQTNPYSTGYLIPLATGDTVKGASIVNKYFTATTGYVTMAVQVNLKNVKKLHNADTLAAKVVLMGSIDDVIWKRIDSATISNSTVYTRTGMAMFTQVGDAYPNYRIWVQGLITGAAYHDTTQIRVYYIQRKMATVIVP